MAKMRKQPQKITQTCADCVHEFACKIWTSGRELSPKNAAICPQFKRTKDTASYLIGKMDGAESAVKHGYWIDKYNDCSCAECSVCGEFYETADQDCVIADSFRLFCRFYKFCPNCGAKMDADPIPDTADRCVCCGDVIPEGRMVCPACEGG